MAETSRKYSTTLAIALTGLLFIGAGLVFAALSNPSRFSSNVKNDRYIDLLAGGGFLCTVLGAGLFLLAANRTTASMPDRNRNNAGIGVGLGFALQLGGIFLAPIYQPNGVAGTLMVLAGLPLFVWGAMYYIEGKGHPKWLGILGILGVFGFLVLILFPNRIENVAFAEEQ